MKRDGVQRVATGAGSPRMRSSVNSGNGFADSGRDDASPVQMKPADREVTRPSRRATVTLEQRASFDA